MNAPTRTSTSRPLAGLADVVRGDIVVLLVQGSKAKELYVEWDGANSLRLLGSQFSREDGTCIAATRSDIAAGGRIVHPNDVPAGVDVDRMSSPEADDVEAAARKFHANESEAGIAELESAIAAWHSRKQ